MLDTARQEIVDLKTRLDVIQIQDLERIVSELRSITYAKDEKLIAAYNQVIHFKKIVDRLEPQVLKLQGALKINESLKKEMDELQRIRVGLLDKNEKDFETFSISLEDLLAFTFEASIGKVVKEGGSQAGAARGEALDDAATGSVTAVEGVATK
ncbi:hypothetical protein ACFX2F_000626 [Malus domestica]